MYESATDQDQDTDSIVSVDTADTDSEDLQLLQKFDTDTYYPAVTDPDIQLKLYQKREFYYYRSDPRPHITTYEDIENIRDAACNNTNISFNHQSLISNFINPDTPYKGLLVFHGLGSGKCVAKDTIVFTNLGHYVIEDLWHDYAGDEIIIDEHGAEWYATDTQDLWVKAYDGTEEVTASVLHLYREKVNTILKRLYLENGYTVTITAVHKLLVMRDSNTNAIWTDDLNEGDVVLTEQGFSSIIAIDAVLYDDYVYDLEIDVYHNYLANGIYCHNTCVGIGVAEKFKPMVQRYGTKITVLVRNTLMKESWKTFLGICARNTYQGKDAINTAMQYYQFLSYKSFHRRVIGEKISDVKSGNKTTYRKTIEGEFERDLAVNHIESLDNTLLIVEEAHNVVNNEFGVAVKKIIDNSVNLKLLLLTGTPIRNSGTDIVYMLNLLRPPAHQMIPEKMFVNTNVRVHELTLTSDGLDYLATMAQGYVSHVRGGDPYVFAKRVDMGVVPPGFHLLKLVLCPMEEFQALKYREELSSNADDPLDKKLIMVANIVIPGLNIHHTPGGKRLNGYSSNQGLRRVCDQLKEPEYFSAINDELQLMFQKILGAEVVTNGEPFMKLAESENNISGLILQLPYLKYFSTKFATALQNILALVAGQKGPGTAFVYSEYINLGINMFKEILLQNGFLEYDELGAYQIAGNTICYYCGRAKAVHIDDKKHTFRPAVFLVVTGSAGKDEFEVTVADDKLVIIDKVFNNVANYDGRSIKCILGSSVINEGINFKNVAEAHILEAYYNLGKIDQAIGRTIRRCSHYQLMNENNVYPEVRVYKYCITFGDSSNSNAESNSNTDAESNAEPDSEAKSESGVESYSNSSAESNAGSSGNTSANASANTKTAEEQLYQHAEQKFMLVKQIERKLKEVAVDCPMNRPLNMFEEEIQKYKHCNEPGEEPCPVECDYTKCEYRCIDNKLNAEYYDPERIIYKKVPTNQLDYSTFTKGMAGDEIARVKDLIKELYVFKSVYLLSEIITYVYESYSDTRREMFDKFFVYKALDALIPLSENDHNNYNDILIDKYGRRGYLIYRDKYYIFQPFSMDESVPMFYRNTYANPLIVELSLYEFLTSRGILQDQEEQIEVSTSVNPYYDFDSVAEYYRNRKEFEYVGSIDKELSRRKNKHLKDLADVFKLRGQRPRVLEKRRGTGIPTFLGSVCSTSLKRDYLKKVLHALGLKINTNEKRNTICTKIRDRLLHLEKYATEKDGNKMTYMIIPANHPDYPFPYNLEDRAQYIKRQLEELISSAAISVRKVRATQVITIKNLSNPTKYAATIEKFHMVPTKNKNEYEIVIE